MVQIKLYLTSYAYGTSLSYVTVREEAEKGKGERCDKESEPV
jgi:hypothetical protein